MLMAAAILLIACGSGDGAVNWDNGDGGSAGNTSTDGGNTGSGSSSGNGEVCNPTMENGWCADADNCECLPTDSTSEEACAASPELCPPDGNKCTPGHNQCGYNLPKGADYQSPVEKCVPYLNGNTWREVGPQYDGEIGNELEANGQLGVGGLIRPDSDEAYSYYTSYSMSGSLLCWNLFNRDNFESAEGKISEDCETIDMSYFKPGSTEPYVTKQFVFIE
jgi:hypothetical protein